MGGLIARTILNKYKFSNLGNILFLATPHHGSQVADFLQNNYLYKRFYGPAGQQLTTDYDLSGILRGPYYDFAIIAGSSSIDPFSSYLIPGDDDSKVSMFSAKLKGATDSVIINSSHTFFPSNEKMLDQVVYFLSNHTFKHD